MFKLCESLSGDLVKQGADCTSLETMKYCYSNTVLGAKLRNLVADHIIRILEEPRCRSANLDIIRTLSGYQGFTSTSCLERSFSEKKGMVSATA